MALQGYADQPRTQLSVFTSSWWDTGKLIRYQY